MGDYSRQRELLERALVIDERTYGRDHAEVAPTLNNLGNVYSDLGDTNKAREVLERALTICERTSRRTNCGFSWYPRVLA